MRALVWRLDEPQPVAVAASAPDRTRIPASTMKLVTSAGALLTLGPRHRFQTTVLAAPDAERRGSTLRGRVYLRGGGDPVLSTTGFARANFNGLGANLDDLARKLRKRGIRRISGPIVGDGTAFDAKRVGPRWRSYYSLYASPLSGLSTNKNLTASGRYAAAPERTAAGRFRQTLRGLGIRQTGGLRTGPTPAGARTIAHVASPPLTRILPLMNGPSDNYLAEMLAKGVAAGHGAPATSAAGTARIAAALSQRGILGPRDRVVDGSGLSRANRLSATTLVRLIAAADADPSWGRALLASLPRGGTGTLRSRLRSVGVRVQAKTGYLNGASGLAGRVVSRRGQRYAFAVLVNGDDVSAARTLQDRVAALLAAGVEDRPARVPTAIFG
jgi:D-alanyl-D-alanine carboxypeptidase/D-alanyl-D-alanine-endopeptidase (penicillin-binding protein 4)